MRWNPFCTTGTKAAKRYQQRAGATMAVYVGTVFLSAAMVRHGHAQGWALYFFSVLPAVPVILVIVAMGRYLQEETDEYLRLITMRALLVATGALLGTLVVNDFLQSFAQSTGLPPFASFIIFCTAFGIAQAVQKLRNRGADE